MAASFRTALLVVPMSMVMVMVIAVSHAQESVGPTPRVATRVIKETESRPTFPSAPMLPMTDIMQQTPEGIAQIAAKVIKENDSKDEVLKNAGQPTTIVPATADEGETWIYHAPPMTVFVEFDAWGVKQVTQRII